jgi:dihydroorotate dehydrogenase
VKPLIISAPFGNYLSHPEATSTLGTFTLFPRPGRLWAALTRIRYYPSVPCWINKIGLHNPGIESVCKANLSGKILSIHGFDMDEWTVLLRFIQRWEMNPLAVELNFSCPNVTDEPIDHFLVMLEAVRTGRKIIAKIPPVDYDSIVGGALTANVPFLHACNTLPMPCGGMSGPALKRYALAAVSRIHKQYGNALSIIGGGGVRTPADVQDYFRAGAERVAVGSALFNPWTVLRLGRLAEAARLACPSPAL